VILAVSTYSKKSQIGMMETILVMLIFFIMLFMGLYYYSSFRGKGIQQEGEELLTQQQEVLLASISSMPELECNNKNCIDATKLIAIKTIINDYKSEYIPLFGFKKIEVELLYPKNQEQQIVCTPQNYPDNCNFFPIYSNLNPNKKSEKTISTPISLYFPSKNQYKLAKLSITQ